jgi:hypothetical protein
MAKIQNIWKILGIVLIILIIFSALIIKNYIIGYSCKDCVIDRTLSGKWYDGWSKSMEKCDNFQNNKDSAYACLTKFTSRLKVEVSIEESEIKVPSLRIANTIIASKNIPAYVFKGEGCRQSFAVDFEGNIYSTGGCLG